MQRSGGFHHYIHVLVSLILGILGCWRITHLLTSEDGPWGILARLRRAVGKSVLGDLLDCFYCLSLWVAAAFAAALAGGWREGVLLWLAISGGAILLERTTDREPAISYIEGGEVHHELLRESARGGA